MINSYKELTIRKYRELVSLEKEGDDDVEYGVDILSILSDIEPEDLLELPLDYKSYVSRENFLEILPYILTVFLVPDGHKYNNGYDIAELAKEFDNNIELPKALCISDFFLHQSLLSIRTSITCLKWKMKRMAKTEKNQEIKTKIMESMAQLESLNDLVKNGVGFTQR